MVPVLGVGVCMSPRALRRRGPPLGASSGMLASASALAGILHGSTFVVVVAAQVAAYVLAVYGALLPAALGGLLALVGLWIILWSLVPSVNELAWMAVVVWVPWISGQVVRDQREQRRQLRTMAARLAHERETSADLAVAQERTRMAGELHQEIARAVAIMISQAATAEAAVFASPARARRDLRTVQDMGRGEITQMRRMLRILRTDHRHGLPPEPRQSSRMQRRIRVPICRSSKLDLVVALTCLVSVEAWVVFHDDFSASERLLSALLAVPATMPLVWRRRMPLAVLVTIMAAVCIQQAAVDYVALTPLMLVVAPLIAFYTLAAEASITRALAGMAVMLMAAGSTTALTEGSAWKFVGGVVFHSVYLAGPFLCGRAVRLHRRQAEQLRTLTVRLKRERDARARLAVLDERTRVARELHDAIAHGVSVMVLQAGAAEQVLATKPEQARQAARAAQEAGRATLAELHPLLGVQVGDGSEQPSVAASLDELDALIEKVSRAGLSVDIQVRGCLPALPVGIDACAYRVIQEGLTNALRHGAPRPVTVSLDFRSDALTIEIVNVMQQANVVGEPGHGLVGMRERVEIYGGVLKVGSTADGRYVLQVRLPLGGERP